MVNSLVVANVVEFENTSRLFSVSLTISTVPVHPYSENANMMIFRFGFFHPNRHLMLITVTVNDSPVGK